MMHPDNTTAMIPPTNIPIEKPLILEATVEIEGNDHDLIEEAGILIDNPYILKY